MTSVAKFAVIVGDGLPSLSGGGRGGIGAATQGPWQESPAEIDRLERDGEYHVGIAATPEASLAVELGRRCAGLAMIDSAAAGGGDTPIHEDVESSTLSARKQARRPPGRFFRHVASGIDENA